MYSRKRWSKRKENLEDFQSQSQDSKPKSGNEKNFSDLDILVAKRKGIRSCTSHLISNFVNYEHLSSSVLAFVTKSAGVEIPNTMEEALKNPEWRRAIMEEMQAIKKKNTWDVVQRPKDKVLVGCK